MWRIKNIIFIVNIHGGAKVLSVALSVIENGANDILLFFLDLLLTQKMYSLKFGRCFVIFPLNAQTNAIIYS